MMIMMMIIIIIVTSGCWKAEPHDRPMFRDVLSLLEEISKSEFVTMTTHESFREIQEDWHREIEEMFDELRMKEKVTINQSLSGPLLMLSAHVEQK